MKFLRYKIGICLLILLVAFSSCNSWLEVEPIDKMNEEQMYKDEAGFFTALNGIYLGLAANELYGQAMSCGFLEVLAQNYDVSLTSHKFYSVIQYDYKEGKTVKPILEGIWQNTYFLIANCNVLLQKSVEKQALLTAGNARLLRGEALALRAFLHFDIFRLWGPMYDESQKTYKCIPYYTAQSTLPEPLLEAEEVGRRILADLDSAEVLLSNDPVISYGQNVNGGGYTGKRHLRMNYYAVKALKARVYLYLGKNQEAYKCATELLDDAKFKEMFPFIKVESVNDSKNPDRFFYTEQLFCMQNLLRDQLYTDLFDPQLEENNFLAPTQEAVVNLFAGADQDYRYKMMWRWNTSGGKVVAFAKYESITDIYTPIRTRVMGLIRLSELYLIAAETAPAVLEKVSYLNQLRLNRGYSASSVSVTDDLPSIIRDEYHREFYGEGQFFFFMKRTKINNWNNVALGETQYILPLPDSEQKYRN